MPLHGKKVGTRAGIKTGTDFAVRAGVILCNLKWAIFIAHFLFIIVYYINEPI